VWTVIDNYGGVVLMVFFMLVLDGFLRWTAINTGVGSSQTSIKILVFCNFLLLTAVDMTQC